jgi:hypothetical protein
MNKNEYGALVYLIDVAIPNSHNSCSIIIENPQKYRLERSANKNMATENVLRNTTITIQNVYYSKKTTRQLETAQFSPWPIYSNAESSSNYTCPIVRKFVEE